MKMPFLSVPRPWWILLLTTLAGCSTSPPTHFYILTPSGDTAGSPAQGEHSIVAVGPVEVSAYLDRSQIVVREGPTRLRLADFHQWAEPLERNIATVLAEDLRAMLPGTQPIVQPWSDLRSDYRVLAKVLRFDSDAHGRVVLHASWAVVGGRERRYRVVRDSFIETQAEGTDFEHVVLAMSEALHRLAAEMAEALREARAAPAHR